jgi:fructan beta-fructosidase
MTIKTTFVFVFFAAIAAVLDTACTEKPAAKTETPPASPRSTTSYDEKHRPQFHFSPEKNWMNDPNGLVFYDGEYHFFYQHYPDSSVWGPMHWGHAVSRDLMHWEHLPIALYPDSLGYIFSGSAVVDRDNTSGFGKDGKPPMVAIFTLHDMQGEKAGRNNYETQGIAYSNDRGRTWTKYAGNPVLPNTENRRDFRDPKVTWDEDSKQWVLALAVGDHLNIYGSKDLKSWVFLSEFGRELGAHGGVWECPDLFKIKVDGTAESKWVLIQNLNPGAPNGGSGAQYFVGNFDGKNFILDEQFARAVPKGRGVWIDYGRDNYAGVTFSDVPAADGRRIFMGWMSNWQYANIVPTEVWRNAATLPRALILKNTPVGYRLFSQPVKELEALRAQATELPHLEVADTYEIAGFNPAQSEFLLHFTLPQGGGGRFGVELSNARGERYRVGYDPAKNQFFSDRTKAGEAAFSKDFVHTAPRFSTEKTVQLHLFFDVASCELFADGGAAAMTDIFFPGEVFTQAKLFSEGGKPVSVQGKAWQLKGIWR